MRAERMLSRAQAHASRRCSVGKWNGLRHVSFRIYILFFAVCVSGVTSGHALIATISKTNLTQFICLQLPLPICLIHCTVHTHKSMEADWIPEKGENQLVTTVKLAARLARVHSIQFNKTPFSLASTLRAHAYWDSYRTLLKSLQSIKLIWYDWIRMTFHYPSPWGSESASRLIYAMYFAVFLRSHFSVTVAAAYRYPGLWELKTFILLYA